MIWDSVHCCVISKISCVEFSQLTSGQFRLWRSYEITWEEARRDGLIEDEDEEIPLF